VPTTVAPAGVGGLLAGVIVIVRFDGSAPGGIWMVSPLLAVTVPPAAPTLA
jgi:hypothetical protein